MFLKCLEVLIEPNRITVVYVVKPPSVKLDMIITLIIPVDISVEEGKVVVLAMVLLLVVEDNSRVMVAVAVTGTPGELIDNT